MFLIATMTKKYSLAAHLIHSRLQLIPNRWGNDLFGVGSRNKETILGLATVVGPYVERDHGIRVEESDKEQAVELCLESIRREREVFYWVVLERDKAGRVREAKVGPDDRIVKADSDDRLNYTQAVHRYEELVKILPRGHWLDVQKRWEVPHPMSGSPEYERQKKRMRRG